MKLNLAEKLKGKSIQEIQKQVQEMIIVFFQLGLLVMMRLLQNTIIILLALEKNVGC